VIALLLRLYPARWRERYGDEFAAVLAERPIGPFDVADVLLGALDAHLHLRGLGAASQHGKGFAMSLRLGGYAAIVGSLLWLLALGTSLVGGLNETWAAPLLLAGSVSLVVALVGVSASQARVHPRLVWAACIVPFVGNVLVVLGSIASLLVGDRPLVGDVDPWALWLTGFIASVAGSGLFALASWRADALSQVGAILLGVGAVLVLTVWIGSATLGPAMPEAAVELLFSAVVVTFAAGWLLTGTAAVRAGRPAYPRAGGFA
jgi:drug/metabolite transporter (DMT)-like permease